jgi:hypothetical protein
MSNGNDPRKAPPAPPPSPPPGTGSKPGKSGGTFKPNDGNDQPPQPKARPT